MCWWLAAAPRPARKPAPQTERATSAAKREREDERSSQKVAEAHAHYAAAVIHEMDGEPRAALEEYYQAALLDPDDEALILEVSRRLLQNKQPEKALEITARAAARPDASGQIYARLGLIYSQLGKTDQAAAANRTAIKKSPGSLAGYQNLFLSYLRQKQPQEALKVLDEAARQPHTGRRLSGRPGGTLRELRHAGAGAKDERQCQGACFAEPRRSAGAGHPLAAPEAGGRLQPAGRLDQGRRSSTWRC